MASEKLPERYNGTCQSLHPTRKSREWDTLRKRIEGRKNDLAAAALLRNFWRELSFGDELSKERQLSGLHALQNVIKGATNGKEAKDVIDSCAELIGRSIDSVVDPQHGITDAMVRKFESDLRKITKRRDVEIIRMEWRERISNGEKEVFWSALCKDENDARRVVECYSSLRPQLVRSNSLGGWVVEVDPDAKNREIDVLRLTDAVTEVLEGAISGKNISTELIGALAVSVAAVKGEAPSFPGKDLAETLTKGVGAKMGPQR